MKTTLSLLALAALILVGCEPRPTVDEDTSTNAPPSTNAPATNQPAQPGM